MQIDQIGESNSNLELSEIEHQSELMSDSLNDRD